MSLSKTYIKSSQKIHKLASIIKGLTATKELNKVNTSTNILYAYHCINIKKKLASKYCFPLFAFLLSPCLCKHLNVDFSLDLDNDLEIDKCFVYIPVKDQTMIIKISAMLVLICECLLSIEESGKNSDILLMKINSFWKFTTEQIPNKEIISLQSKNVSAKSEKLNSGEKEKTLYDLTFELLESANAKSYDKTVLNHNLLKQIGYFTKQWIKPEYEVFYL